MQGEKIYDYVVDITGMTDFGVSFAAISAGEAPIPPAGARFDFTFEGRVTGRISGRIHGVDYFLLRADGRGELNVRGVIETDDGQRIAMIADGVTTAQPDGSTALFENVRLTTASEAYAWVNTRQIWATGSSANGKIAIAGYLQ